MATPLQERHENNSNTTHDSIKSSLKRSKSFGLQRAGVSFAPNKKLCLSPMLSRRNSATIAALYNDSSSSSDEDQDDSQDESCYVNNQRRARKRAFSFKRSASFSDNKLNRAVSKYSDDDEEDVTSNVDVKETRVDESIEKKITAIISPRLSPKQEQIEIEPRNIQLSSPVSNAIVDSIEPTPFTKHGRHDSFTNQSLSGEAKSNIRRSSFDGDQTARSRCFEYLVSAIDEAWARYCDATTYAEDEVFHNDNNSYLPNTPASLGLSDNEDFDEDKREIYDDLEDGYKSASTNITEYDSDFDSKRRASTQPSSVKLQHLKDRLLKAKYYLQDFIESDSVDEACAFWKRWDLVKYATIELVEDDDDDEIIESTIEDLEKGRLYGYS
ncbi:hypothetical protein BN7_5001 [Wickerhamomyces ciferrii]|uniref:Uncharacterized protein n=1 Tax=Wickerhamomyces ciferrii (strain ATCC 14091 / BCRC 22168 / CBS 111 / JCM 3599 / NBRC 0793 / NRRL Y-1031 F-60-10) TaxID=1206466 RepID=K0KVE5_WICCF|nr:uncharacterized protein BN7_5001 [Wickerhamomyces ciferrii]CCH45419.1 hypothetical protein BN7_5001 [Wickerhamomyces ciferrii]